MELLKKINDTTSVVLIPSDKNYSKINISKKDYSVAFHPGIDETFNCFEASHWQPANIFVIEVESEKKQTLLVGDIILGKSNNITLMPLEVLRVTDVMPHTKSVCCDGIWTDGSGVKILASNILEVSDKMGNILKFDHRDMGGDEKVTLLSDEQVKDYLKLFKHE